MKERFDIRYLGKLKYFLGIEIALSNKDLFLSQRKYVLDLPKETGKLRVKPASIPMETSKKTGPEDGDLLENISQFQRLTGKLIFLTVTRPNIAFTISAINI